MPWPQRRYEPQRLAGIADGAGITVAVIDSGVDSRHPQLRRSVLEGHDFLPGSGSGDGRTDCVAHGTAVASIIAAAPVPGTGFAGLAPGARILPIRVTETGDSPSAGRPGTAAGLAQAITAAVRDGAEVLNVSMVLYEDDARVRQAVHAAVEAGAVVVAAAGNAHGRAAAPDPVPYPATYPGVIGVGAIDADGARLAESQVGSYVDIAAPGADVTAAVPVSGLGTFTGTSFAVPFVSATAALILSRHGATPSGRARVREVTARITGTADPGSSYPVLNPYRAVTEIPTVTPAPRRPADLPDGSHQTIRASEARSGALVASGAALAAAALVLLLANVLARGSRRRWRAGPAGGGTGPAAFLR